MTTMASQITSLTVVYSTVYSDADQRNHQSSASLAFVWGIHRDRWIPRTKGQLRGKCFHLMTSSWFMIIYIYISSALYYSHMASSSWENKPVNNKETNGLPTFPPLSKIFCLRTVTRYFCDWCATVIICGQCWVVVMVADGMVPIWPRDIYNHHDEVGHSVRLRSLPK